MSSAEADLDELFTSFSRQAWRWERQGTYRQPGEIEPWRRWREGEHDDLEWLRPWLLNVEAATNRGRYFQRVRVFSEPPTEYQLWQIDVSPANIAAGEELHILTESQAGALDLPAQDFWIFDDQRVALMYFEDEQFVGHKIVTEPDEVERYRQYKALAWRQAVPFSAYLREPTLRSL